MKTFNEKDQKILTDYIEFVKGKWKKNEDPEIDFRHKASGLSDEIGEVASLYKKKFRHGIEVDETDLKMELGDIIFYCVVHGEDFIKLGDYDYITNYDYPNEFDFLFFDTQVKTFSIHLNIHRDKEICNLLFNYISYVCDKYFNFDIIDLININIKKLTKRHGKGQATLETDLNKNEEDEKNVSNSIL